LILAAENGHTVTVKALIDAKANVNAKNNDGNTALMLAAVRCRSEVMKEAPQECTREYCIHVFI
jgi:ankyrin repeat protein